MLSRRDLTGAVLAGAAASSTLLVGSAAFAQAPADEATFDRIRRTKVLRAAALPGELPYFKKDLATGEWSGAAADMCRDIAKVMEAKVEWLESTYGNSVLDLQSNKIDLAFSLNPTPQRALVIGFSRPVFLHGFGTVAKKGFEPKTWGDLNRPELKVAVDIGSVHELAARNFAPKAQIVALKSR